MDTMAKSPPVPIYEVLRVKIREDGGMTKRAVTSDKAAEEAETDFRELQAEEGKGLTACADEIRMAGNDGKGFSRPFRPSNVSN